MAPHEFSEAPTAQAAEAPRDQNPYASPQTTGPLLAKNEVPEPIGIWRAGNVLIMHRAAALPPRCIVTNEPCDETELHELLLDSRRTIRIAQGAIGLVGGLCSVGFLFSHFPDRHIPAAGSAVLALLIIALFTMRKPSELRLRYGIKRADRTRRLILRYAGAIFFVAGLLTFIVPAGIAPQHHWATIFFAASVLLMVGGAVAFLRGRFPLRIERPPCNYLVIHGCGREFLGNFPHAAIGLPFLGRISPKPLA